MDDGPNVKVNRTVSHDCLGALAGVRPSGSTGASAPGSPRRGPSRRRQCLCHRRLWLVVDRARSLVKLGRRAGERACGWARHSACAIAA
jgi:hypothetical protein